MIDKQSKIRALLNFFVKRFLIPLLTALITPTVSYPGIIENKLISLQRISKNNNERQQ